MQQLVLSEHWQLKQRNPACALADDWISSSGWMPTVVPGTVHETLLAVGQIPDPFYGLNEHEVQWIGEQEWLYRCEFNAPPELANNPSVALCFDGLDTIATVWLNGEQILHSDNMFVPQRVPVQGVLRPGSNVLQLLFASALRHGQALEREFGKRAVWNGDASRVYVRKAQYHYGWDWGPCLLTAGPWKAIRIEAGPRIVDLYAPTQLTDDLTLATLQAEITSDGADYVPSAIHLQLFDPQNALVAEASLPWAPVVQHTLMVDQPHLWWPNGHGEQPLYRLVATLQDGDVELDSREQRLGMRQLRLVQEPLAEEPGTTFLFECNHRPLFCGGANWIPADSLPTRLTAADYRVQLEQAAAANMVMVRIWGGGIYEADIFYDVCDELGLLVWQDFMFACGIYPAHTAFLESVRREAEVQVRRLRHHPALALWCGNNEDYQIAQSLGVYDPAFAGDFTTTSFPAREIYERLLPEVCQALDPGRPYWPGSSYGGTNVVDPTVGDRHTWEIWHGAMVPYGDYPKYEGRFVSEFGLESCPSLALLESVTPPHERFPQSLTIEHHNKSEGGPRRLAVYLNDTLRVADTLSDYVYATQFVQAEAMASAYGGWRRRWGGPGTYAVAGALVWQLNDCWPVISWAIVDYARQPKPAYYVIARALAPLAVELARTPGGFETWAVNATSTVVEAVVHVDAFALDGTALLHEQRSVTLQPLHASELGTVPFAPTTEAVVAVRLVVGDTTVARATAWPEPFKYLTLPDPALTIMPLGEDWIEVRAERPAKGVWLAAGSDVRWSDNMLDVMPNDSQRVRGVGLGDRRVEVQWLCTPERGGSTGT